MKKVLFFLGLLAIANLLFSQSVDVTFQVDMQNQTVSPDGVHIAGSFQGWDPSATLMSPSGSGDIYEVTVSLTAGETIEYKYINGNAWGADESVPASCAQNNNRYLTVPASDTVLDEVCFGSCLACVLPQVNITFQVDMSNETVSPDGVHLAGSFQSWDPSATPMTDMGNNIYAVTLSLGVGEYHEYKFINGNAWGADESVPAECATNNNRSYTVPASDDTIDVVCFGSCSACTPIVNHSITFQVDMTGQTVSPDGVHIAGSFQGWDPGATLMTNKGGNIWTYTTDLPENGYYEYKFVNGTTWGEDESVPSSCNQNGNRYINVPPGDTILTAVCFGSCNICNPPTHDVTFTVDMSNQNVSPAGVHIAGSFQGWDPAADSMTNVSENYYQITFTLGEGDYIEYKFINGDTFGDAEFVPGECNSGGNRYFTVPSNDVVLDTVCYGECSACQSTLYSFNLSVFLQGNFNGSSMNTALYDMGMLSNEQPYNSSPWNYDGLESLNAPSEANVVDWVLVEFRQTSGDASTATADKFLDHQAALLLADGSIVKPDGVSPIQLTANITDNLYVVIYHRNHLAVMSANALTNTGNVYSYDFTDALSKAYSDGQVDLGNGHFGMIAGDSDGNGVINADDKDINWNNDSGKQGYYNSDLNADSEVDNKDKNDVWEQNFGLQTSVPN